jgi:hypothetical protein
MRIPQTYQFFSDGTLFASVVGKVGNIPGVVPSNPLANCRPDVRCNHPEQLFFNGEVLLHVTAKDKVNTTGRVQYNHFSLFSPCCLHSPSFFLLAVVL